MTRRTFLEGALLTGLAGPRRWGVAVYGATPCGIAAAVGAARSGARVVLIEPTRHVGGMNTSGVNTAESEHMLAWTIGGFALEFYKRLGRRYGTGKPEFYFESSVAESVFLELLREASIEVQYGRRVTKVGKHGNRLFALELDDGSDVEAVVFVDASYEGDVMARAGVPYGIGREGTRDYGEEAAGIRFDRTTHKALTVDSAGRLLPGVSAWAHQLKEGAAHHGVMCYNFRLTFARDPSLKVPIPLPRRYEGTRFALLKHWLEEQIAVKRPIRLTDFLDFYPRRNGKFEVNNKQASIFSLGHLGGQFEYPDADYPTRDRIIADHWDYTLGLLYFLAHDDSVPDNVRAEMRSWGLHRGEFVDNGHLPYQLYVREARRMRGAFLVTQRDVTVDRRKPDAIGLSSHFIDCHHVQRVALSRYEFVNEGRIWRIGWAYQIPYRALTPRPEDCENLLVPCAASFSHVAFSTYRLESVWMIGGFAAGIAAAMAARGSAPVQAISVATLQDRLRRAGQVIDFLPGQPEKWNDPRGGTGGPPEF